MVPAAPEPPAIIENWDPETPAPRGYRMDDTINGRMLGVGIGLLGTGWFLSIIVGGIGAASEEDDPNDAADGVTAEDWSVLYLPVVGPLVAIDTLDARTSGVGVLIADAVIQIGGAAGIVGGLVDRKYRLVRTDYGSLSVTPVIGPNGSGFVAQGRF